MPARHAVDRVVDENDGNRDPELGGVHDLGQADRGQIAVTLVAHHNGLGVGDLVTETDGRGPAVGGLRVARIKVIVKEDRASYRRDHDGAVPHPELDQKLGDVLVGQSVSATRTIVGRGPLQSLAVSVSVEVLEEGSCRRHRDTSVISLTLS